MASSLTVPSDTALLLCPGSSLRYIHRALMQIHGYCQCSTMQCKRSSCTVYNLGGSCLAVLFLQGKHSPDLILVLVALAGRVSNIIVLLRPQPDAAYYMHVTLSSLSHAPQLRSFVHDHVIISDASAPSLAFQSQVSLLLVMSQE
jgi:hypothetical protein